MVILINQDTRHHCGSGMDELAEDGQNFAETWGVLSIVTNGSRMWSDITGDANMEGGGGTNISF